ncbi:MAG: type II toxin-antitoxin system HicB family antitoxin [Acidimicrobiales bacterium]
MREELNKYEYVVTWSDEDQEFIGTCLEFPSLSWLDASRTRAFNGIVSLVEAVVADMEETGEKIPDPLSVRQYSGKFQLRTSPHLHAQLVREAAEHGLSLNSFANQKLAAR